MLRGVRALPRAMAGRAVVRRRGASTIFIQPRVADAIGGYFQKRLQEESGASLEVLKQTKSAAVFAVRFPPSDRNEEQVMVCLAFGDPTNAAAFNVVQYAIKPTRLGVDLVEAHLKSWRDKLLRQAEAMNAAPSS